ncbi:MAG: UPF0158 family protein [Chloroflexota bacterium]
MITIPYADLKQALTNTATELMWYLDSKTGKMILHSEDIDLGDDGAFLDQLDLFPDRYLKIDRLPAKETHQFMIYFLNEINDNKAKVALAQALASKRPGQLFRQTVTNYPKLKREWNAYEIRRNSEYIISWLQTQGIEATVK